MPPVRAIFRKIFNFKTASRFDSDRVPKGEGFVALNSWDGRVRQAPIGEIGRPSRTRYEPALSS